MNVSGVLNLLKKTAIDLTGHKRIQRIYITIAAVVGSLGFSLYPITNVFATSIYDNVYNTTSTLVLGNDGWSPYYTPCTDVDYTNTWATALLSAPEMTSAFKDSFKTALSSGRWFVSQGNTLSYGHNYSSIAISWTEDASLSLTWSGNYVFASGDSTYHNVLLRNKNAQTVGTDCSPYAILNGGGAVSSTQPSGSDDTYKNLFVYSDSLNIPTGYAGPSINTTPTGPIEVSGIVHCAYDTGIITNIHVSPSSGVAGDATLTDLSDGLDGVSYRYHLSEVSSYYLEVDCGGSNSYNTPIVNTSTSTQHNFACASGGATACVED